MPRKIFCIGFHKTGTTSIGEALRLLGYSVTGPNGVKDPRIAKSVLAMADNLVGRFDAFKDNPWPVLCKGLDGRYPGSEFTLTVRPTDLWIRSQVHHFGTRETPMRTWIYGKGCPEGNEGRHRAVREPHRDVIAHFGGRSDDLLVMDLAQRDPWERLCPFLGVERPDFAFSSFEQGGRPVEGNTVPCEARAIGGGKTGRIARQHQVQ
ncbi:MAG TPA: sulfotransferase [Acidimicrobiia bacterium]|nr:sulfotransferase [Acidimicrobiia bacterium]